MCWRLILEEFGPELSPHSPKDSQTIASVHRYDQLISWHVAKAIWYSFPINCFNLQNFKYNWKYEHQKCFDAIKHMIGREVLLAYPDFNVPFEIHNDASKLQTGAIVSQKGNPIAFYSRKMNSAQQNYTTTDKELHSIVATLKEFRDILLGHQITVYTDHKNLTYKNLRQNA